ncbi:MAG: long-chain fatty acid--CoA ligase [Hyphomicrobiales bacterium]|nr:long-chain fatty acid--CoA ligase [Hyphomicrobiales bacterium]
MTPDRIAYREFDRAAESWRSYTWRDVAYQAARWQHALAEENLAPGDRIAIKLRNGIDWVCVHQSALSLGLVVTPLYLADSPQSTAYFLRDCEARLLVVGSDTDWAAVAPHLGDEKKPQTVVCLRESTGTDPRVRGLEDWLPQVDGSLALTEQEQDPDRLATIIYTSGTTGLPKGVMLSHHNLLFGTEAVLRRVQARADDVFISFMPLAHVFEQTIGYYLPMMAGCAVGYARSPHSLPEDLLQIRPTVFVSVPRVYEKAYEAIRRKTEKSLISHHLLDATIRLGWRHHGGEPQRGRGLNLFEWVSWKILHVAVARRILSRFGGRVRVAVAGGAPMPTEVARFFVGIGMPVLEGYGLVEAGAPVCGNGLDDNVIGSVGRPLPGIDVSIGDGGEILVRAPSVMLGYWNPTSREQEPIDKDGWLHTGDIGEAIDGRIYIHGRMKEIIVTSTGEKVPPNLLEMNIALDPLIDQVMVVGEGRPRIVAVIVLNGPEWTKVANDLDLDPDATASLHSENAMKVVLDRIAEKLQMLPAHCQVHQVHLTLTEWTIEHGLVTATLKLRRHVLEKHFSTEIKEMYRDRPAPG